MFVLLAILLAAEIHNDNNKNNNKNYNNKDNNNNIEFIDCQPSLSWSRFSKYTAAKA